MFRITECLSVGPFASAERAEELLAAGVTHVLNVSHVPSVVSPETGFAGVAWVPMYDSHQIPLATVTWALDTLHRLASVPSAHVYVHCQAGMLRGPTILWLYLIALGVPPNDARDWIEERSPVAVPGHYRIVATEHVLHAQKYGLKHFFPHPRANLIVPVPLPDEAE
jgi:protein-tyrosine phosphatase